MSDLADARHAILEAELIESVAERYLAAHLAAQRVALVVLSAHAGARKRLRSGPADPWTLLARVAPECGEWAAYFSATQPKRLAVAAGARSIVSGREADDLVRDAANFHAAAARYLRVHHAIGSTPPIGPTSGIGSASGSRRSGSTSGVGSTSAIGSAAASRRGAKGA